MEVRRQRWPKEDLYVQSGVFLRFKNWYVQFIVIWMLSFCRWRTDIFDEFLNVDLFMNCGMLNARTSMWS